MGTKPALNLGAWRRLDGGPGGTVLRLPAHHLMTHGVVVGMTGSGKTGLVTVLLEEALRAGVPSIVVDVKGDLPNLLLGFPSFAPEPFVPWLEASADGASPNDVLERATRIAADRRAGLEAARIGEPELRAYAESAAIRVLTPGSSAGEPLHVLSPLERRSSRWDTDPESARSALSAAVSLALRLLGRDPDPAKSKEHVLLSLLAERRPHAGGDAERGYIIEDIVW
jgi:DNA helicase HerA-like ATPase